MVKNYFLRSATAHLRIFRPEFTAQDVVVALPAGVTLETVAFRVHVTKPIRLFTVKRIEFPVVGRLDAFGPNGSSPIRTS